IGFQGLGESEPPFLFWQRSQKMFHINLLLAVADGLRLSCLESGLYFFSQAIEVHDLSLPYCASCCPLICVYHYQIYCLQICLSCLEMHNSRKWVRFVADRVHPIGQQLTFQGGN